MKYLKSFNESISNIDIIGNSVELRKVLNVLGIEIMNHKENHRSDANADFENYYKLDFNFRSVPYSILNILSYFDNKYLYLL